MLVAMEKLKIIICITSFLFAITAVFTPTKGTTESGQCYMHVIETGGSVCNACLDISSEQVCSNGTECGDTFCWEPAPDPEEN